MKKILYLFLALFLFAQSFILFSCKNNNEGFLFVCPDGAPALSISKYIYENNNFGLENKVNYKIVSSNRISEYMIRGDAEIIVLPINAATKLYKSKKDDYKLISVLTHGNLYVVSKEEISLSQLSNKTIAVLGQGLVPDLTLKVVLKKYGIKNVEFKYFANASDVIPQLKQNIISFALLPEPAFTNLKKLDSESEYFSLDLQSLYNENESYPQAVLMIKNSLLQKHEDIVEKMKSAFDNGLSFVKKNTELAIESINGITEEGVVSAFKKDLPLTTIDNCHIFWQDALDAKESVLEYINQLKEISENSVNTSLNDFFYGDRI